MGRSRRRETKIFQQLEIVDQLMDGRGVAKPDGKVVFVDGALRDEKVSAQLRRKHKGYDEAQVLQVHQSSPHRIPARCAVYGLCGGCVWQHASAEFELRSKQAAVLDEIQRIGRTQAEQVFPPLVDRVWKYRRRARLAVKHVEKKGRVLVGFREQHNPYVVDMKQCEVLDPIIAEQLVPLSELLGELKIKSKIPQIEVAAADNACALVFRVLEIPDEEDVKRMDAYAQNAGMQVFLQSGGPETITPIRAYPQLYYELAAYNLRFQFGPLDFVQVHEGINCKMIAQALDWLQVRATDRVLDLFCGLGNFSLPLAARAASVVGVEGDQSLVNLAQANARLNNVNNTQFIRQDLYTEESLDQIEQQRWDLVLLDPPRSGANGVLKRCLLNTPRAILYVSCHPGTLARDTESLVHELGYRLAKLRVMNMFPQTSHIECMALFLPQ